MRHRLHGLAPHVCRWLATDVSADMVAIARDKLVAQSTPGLAFAVADADGPVVSAGTFDAVMAFNLLHLVHDLPAALRQVADALRPGGRFISKTPCVAEMNPLVGKLIIPVMQAFGKAPHVLCLRTAQLEQAIRDSGLEILALEWHGTRGRDIRPFIVARKTPMP
ncbi:MAG: class I SAM-dependent methyltransferase [Burkholderiaceae bacterium]